MCSPDDDLIFGTTSFGASTFVMVMVTKHRPDVTLSFAG
jgi:hypothetical protein